MFKKKYSRTPNRFMNRVWIGLFSYTRHGGGRRVWKGAKGIMGIWGADTKRQPMPLFNFINDPSSELKFKQDTDTWGWEIPLPSNYPMILESNEEN